MRNTFYGNLGGSFAGSGLTYSGTGTLKLSGTSNYTGPTSVSSGTLTLANGGNLGATAVGTSYSGL